MGKLTEQYNARPVGKNRFYDWLTGKVVDADGLPPDADDIATVQRMLLSDGCGAATAAAAISSAGWPISASPITRFLNGHSSVGVDHPLHGSKL